MYRVVATRTSARVPTTAACGALEWTAPDRQPPVLVGADFRLVPNALTPFDENQPVVFPVFYKVALCRVRLPPFKFYCGAAARFQVVRSVIPFGVRGLSNFSSSEFSKVIVLF